MDNKTHLKDSIKKWQLQHEWLFVQKSEASRNGYFHIVELIQTIIDDLYQLEDLLERLD